MIEYKRPNLDYNISYTKSVYEIQFKEIIKSIADQYPDSNFARENVTDDLKYMDFEDVMKLLYEYFSYEVIGICGCGNSDETIENIVNYLTVLEYWTDHVNDDNICSERERMTEQYFSVAYASDNPLLQFMAYILDDKNLTDHGSSINGAWITDLGRVCLYVYKIYLKQQGKETKMSSD